nr:hypothetical protein Q903MT_gene10 [Picea sitchensis]
MGSRTAITGSRSGGMSLAMEQDLGRAMEFNMHLDLGLDK